MRNPLFIWEPPPHNLTESNKRYYDNSPKEVWNELTNELSHSIFTINRTIEQFGIIDASFEISDNICEYIECGRVIVLTTITVDYPGAKKGDIKYKFNPCEKNRIILQEPYRINRRYVPRIIDYSRQPVLKGKINIHIIPDGNGTSVMVNCNYTFNVRLYGTTNIYNEFGVGPLNTEKYNKPYFPNITFSTTQRRGTAFWRGSRFTCFNKGTLETEILDMIK